MIWGIISLILLLVVIGLVIWLLVKHSETCPTKAGVNQPCNSSVDCNGGLVCSVINGITGATGSVGGVTVGVAAVGTGGRVCKVAYGGICSANTECASGQVCRGGVCTVPLGTQGRACPCDTGFTCMNNVCRAIVGQACTSNTDCSTGNCQNNICFPAGMTGMTGNTGSWCNSSDSSNSRCHSSRHSYDSSDSRHHDSSYDSRHHNSSYDSRDTRHHNSSDSRDSGSYEHDKKHSDFYSCSDSDCGKTPYSMSDSHNSTRHCNRNSSLSSNSHASYVRRGVYVTNQQNQDQTLFTGIEQPIIDVVKTDKIYLLLKNGNIAANSGINNVMYVTDKKMSRMVRFGNDILGLNNKGKIHQAVKSASNTWTWEHLRNFPCDAIFIDSTNNGGHLEVLTASDKSYLYVYSANWKDGNKMATRKTNEPRFYGKDINRYLDLNEQTNVGKTNDHVKIKHCKAAGFYPNDVLVAVLDSDSFTHVRLIDNNAYFLFEQNC